MMPRDEIDDLVDWQLSQGRHTGDYIPLNDPPPAPAATVRQLTILLENAAILVRSLYEALAPAAAAIAQFATHLQPPSARALPPSDEKTDTP